MVKLRETPRLKAQRDTIEKLADNDPQTVRAIDKLAQARRSPRLTPDAAPMTVTMREKDLVTASPQTSADVFPRVCR